MTIDRGVTVALTGLEPHPHNYNKHPKRQVEELRRSLRVFGQVRDIVVWGAFIVAGHGVVEAARLEGWESISATRLPDDWPEERVLAYLATDNETARLSEPDDAQLAALLQAVSDEELRALAAGGESRLRQLMRTEVDDPGAQVDRAEELRQKWGVELGQLWRIGEHRLLCGDSTRREDVERVMDGEKADLLLSDPPYGKLKIFNSSGAVGNAGGNLAKVKHYGAFEGAHDFDIKPMFAALDGCYSKAIIWGGNYFADVLPITVSWLVWDKRAGAQLFYADCELAWSNLGITAKVFTFTWQGMIRQGDKIERCHPTQKPVELYEWCLGLADKAMIVIDPTLGSGTTIVACQKLGRKTRAIEIAPGYCAVTLQRMADAFPGLPIERVE